MKNNQKGFTAVEMLLVIIVIILIVGVGFYVFNSNKETKDAAPISTSKNTKAADESQNPTLVQAEAVAKEYYQFRYVEKWNEQVPSNQLSKWLTPELSDQLKGNDGYQGGADSDNITQGGGFTVPDSVAVKGIAADNSKATVKVTFVSEGVSDESAPSTTVSLVPGGDTWLIASAQKN